MKKIYYLPAIMMYAVVSVYAQPNAGTNKHTPNKLYQKIAEQKAQGHAFSLYAPFENEVQKNSSVHGDYSVLQLNTVQHDKLLTNRPHSFTLQLPDANQSPMILELTQVDPLSDTKIYYVDVYGKQTFTPGTQLYYRGVVKDKHQSLAAITISKSGIEGLIADETGNYSLAKIAGSPSQFALANDRELLRPQPFECHTIDEEDEPLEKMAAPLYAIPCVKLQVECDYQLFLQHGSNMDNVHRYVTTLFNQLAAVYNIEDIDLGISEIVVWTIDDPYSPVYAGPNGDTATSRTALDKFAFAIQDNYPGEISCLLAHDNDDLGGLAWRDQLCKSYDAGNNAGPYLYCDVDGYTWFNFPNYAWDINVWAHELGHSLGSRHTHWCDWPGGPIDYCGPLADSDYAEGSCTDGPIPVSGTIMSYCHLLGYVGVDLALGFGPFPGDFIRSKVANAACLDTCVLDCLTAISITQPLSADEVAHFEASNTIAGFSRIHAGADVQFDAGKSIVLKPGFRADEGVVFRAYIDGCIPEPDPFSLSENRPAFASAYANEAPFSIEPNPFTSFTTVRYTLTAPQSVSLFLFHINGSMANQILQKEVQEAGLHTMPIDISHLPAGMYVIILEIDGARTAKRIIMSDSKMN